MDVFNFVDNDGESQNFTPLQQPIVLLNRIDIGLVYSSRSGSPNLFNDSASTIVNSNA